MLHGPGDSFGGRRFPVRGARNERRVQPWRSVHVPIGNRPFNTRRRLRVTRGGDGGRPRGRRFALALPFRHCEPARLRRRLDHQRPRVEPEIRRLLLPHAPELLAVDVALRSPGHQRRALGKARAVGGASETALGHRRLDLGAARGERIHDLARHARDLEAPVRMRLLDRVSESAKPARELVALPQTSRR